MREGKGEEEEEEEEEEREEYGHTGRASGCRYGSSGAEVTPRPSP